MPLAFISHSTKDRDVVEAIIVRPLQSWGVETWYAKTHIRTSEAWEQSLKDGLQECDFVVAVMTPHSTQSEWVKDEVHWAITNKPDSLIPVLLEPCAPTDIHIRLGRIQHIDFVESNDGNGALLRAVGIHEDRGFQFRISGGPTDGMRFIVTSTRVMGRDPSCDIIIARPLISRKHCRLEVSGTDILAYDLSRHGITVNGSPINRKCAFLEIGDTVQLTSEVEVRLELIREISGDTGSVTMESFEPVTKTELTTLEPVAADRNYEGNSDGTAPIGLRRCPKCGVVSTSLVLASDGRQLCADCL